MTPLYSISTEGQHPGCLVEVRYRAGDVAFVQDKEGGRWAEHVENLQEVEVFSIGEALSFAGEGE